MRGRTHISFFLHLVLGGIALAAVLLFAACETDVNAVEHTDVPYSIYGVFTPQADTQRIRVIPIIDRLNPDEAEDPEVEVLSVDLTSGETVTWQRDSDEGRDVSIGSVYFAPFAAAYSHRYRLTAERDDGAVTSVELKVPSSSSVEVGAGTTSYPASIPIAVTGDHMQLLHVEITYHLDYRYAAPVPDNTPPPDPFVTLDYDEMISPTATGWHIPVNLSADFVRLFLAIQGRSGAQVNRLYGLRIRDLTVSFLAASEAWSPPDGTFDPEVLVQPGTMSNINNGFGFIGAGYRVETKWVPDDAVAEAAGFVVPRDTSQVPIH